MQQANATHAPEGTYDRLLTTLEQLLAIEATDLRDALTQVAQLLSEALAADKFDAFLYDPAVSTLVSLGVSDTPMGHHQRAAGLDRLPIANRGRTVQVFQTQTGYCTGHADQDPDELVGIVETLGVRSTVAVPLGGG
jgi:two-component system, OmpR family, sensor kinase